MEGLGSLHGKTISPSRVRGGKAAVAGCAPQHDKQPERKQKMVVKFITMKGVSGIAATPMSVPGVHLRASYPYT